MQHYIIYLSLHRESNNCYEVFSKVYKAWVRSLSFFFHFYFSFPVCFEYYGEKLLSHFALHCPLLCVCVLYVNHLIDLNNDHHMMSVL